MLSIIIGVVFIIGGLSGKMVLRGTESSMGIVVVGAGLIVWGIYKMTRTKE